MALTDSELIEKIQGGEKHHYSVIIARYKDKAYSLALRILGNPMDAEEALQDAFVKTYNALGKFEGRAKFSTWFYRIVYNTCVTKVNQRGPVYERLEYDDDREYTGTAMLHGSLVELNYETKDMIAFIKKIILELPKKYGTILTLFYLEEMTHEELCEVLQLPLGTVKAHLFRARTMLRERLLRDLGRDAATA